MPYTHGGDIYGDAAVELDFSVNTNRLGMPQAVRDAVMASAAAWEQYPDALCRKLRRAAAAFYEADGTPIPEDWLVFGNGASDILYAVVSAIRPKQAILLAPGFSEYEQALRMCGCEIRWLHLKEENGFSLESAREELYAMLFDGSGDTSKIDSVPTLSSKHENVREKILILGNPNNPTGRAGKVGGGLPGNTYLAYAGRVFSVVFGYTERRFVCWKFVKWCWRSHYPLKCLDQNLLNGRPSPGLWHHPQCRTPGTPREVPPAVECLGSGTGGRGGGICGTGGSFRRKSAGMDG